MLSIILWTIGGFIALSILFFLIKILLVIMGVRSMISIVKQEIEHLPQDYDRMRKTVENENASVGQRVSGVAKQAVKTGWCWFRS